MSEVSGTAPADPSPNESPAPSYRVMRAVVIGLGVVMVVMFGLVVSKLFSAMQGRREEASASVDKPVSLTFPAGATLVQMELQNDRLVLHLRTPKGDEIDIIDTQSGRLVGRVGFESEPK